MHACMHATSPVHPSSCAAPPRETLSVHRSAWAPPGGHKHNPDGARKCLSCIHVHVYLQAWNLGVWLHNGVMLANKTLGICNA